MSQPDNSARKDEIAKLRQDVGEGECLTPTERAEVDGWNAAIDTVLKALTSYEEERTPSDFEAPIDLADAIERVRGLVKSEAGRIAYFDDELDRLVTIARRTPSGEGWQQRIGRLRGALELAKPTHYAAECLVCDDGDRPCPTIAFIAKIDALLTESEGWERQ
jgi:hypothetical protein